MRLNEIKTDKAQPRKTFSKESIEGLAQTIKEHGLINPIEIDNNKVIIDGERRWRALNLLGKTDLIEGVDYKILTKELSDSKRFERQCIADIQNEAIPLEERDLAWKHLLKTLGPKATNVNLAKRLGVSETNVSHALDRLRFKGKLNEPINVSNDVITETITIKDHDQRVKVLKKAEKEVLGSRRIRKFVREYKKSIPEIKEVMLETKYDNALDIAEAVSDLPEDTQKEVIKEAEKHKHLSDNKISPRFVEAIAEEKRSGTYERHEADKPYPDWLDQLLRELRNASGTSRLYLEGKLTHNDLLNLDKKLSTSLMHDHIIKILRFYKKWCADIGAKLVGDDEWQGV